MSKFVVSARKYRPVHFKDVVGQQHVSQTLKNALKNEQLAHAFLFCGPRGVGKTTCARILAKVLNCENRTEEFEACNECSSCKSFDENASFNIHELDAASNNSVDHIRSLVEQVRFQPQQGKYKIYIIDEVHMLSQAAFNAFLKTLEEPPPYAIFILATTEKHKIIPTILSRCQIFDFFRIQVPDIMQHLKHICEQETIVADDDALHIIGQKADGALRDALSIFDRLISFSGKRLTYDDVITNLNILDYDYYFKVSDAMLKEDVGAMLSMFDEILSKGFEPDIFINGFAEHLRNLLVAQDVATLKLLQVGDTIKMRYETQAALAPKSFLLSGLNIANECDVNYKMARNKRLHVEMALIKMCYINRAVKLTSNGQVAGHPNTAPEKKNLDLSENPQKAAVSAAKPNQKVVAEPKTSSPLEKKLPSLNLGKSLSIGSLSSLMEEVVEEEKQEEARPVMLTQEHLETAWKEFAETVVKQNTVRTSFKQVKLSIEGEKARVTLPSQYAEGNIRSEKELMPFLRKRLGSKSLLIEFVIDLSLKPKVEKPKTPKILNEKDKYQLLNQRNPHLSELVRRLDLSLGK